MGRNLDGAKKGKGRYGNQGINEGGAGIGGGVEKTGNQTK